MNTFILPGELVHLARIKDYLNDAICGILIHQKIGMDEVNSSGAVPTDFAGRVFTLRALTQINTGDVGESDRLIYEKCLTNILSDPRVHYLATRSYLNSPFNNSIVVERIVLNSILIIRRTQASRLVASSTPHSVEAWIFAKCFEHLNLPVYVLERTPINDRVWIYRDLDRQRVVPQKGGSATELSASSRKVLKEQRDSKPGEKDANGFYLSRMELSSIKGAESNAWWSLRRELSFLSAGRFVTLPLRLLSFWLKRRLLRSYGEVSMKGLPKTPFVVYFMHYQPERSSLPEGLYYVQQWLAVRLLSWAIPAGWTLVVREHPSMWLHALDITVRTPGIYREIASLPNVEICSMDIDTFEVIDRSTAVATLTGSVGFQAILRNRPVLALGLPAYKDHPACFSVSSLDELQKALHIVSTEDLSNRFTDEALVEYLGWVERNSICSDPSESDWLEARLKNFTEFYRRIFAGDVELS
jgi:hypothetical protein